MYREPSEPFDDAKSEFPRLTYGGMPTGSLVEAYENMGTGAYRHVHVKVDSSGAFYHVTGHDLEMPLVFDSDAALQSYIRGACAAHALQQLV